MPGPAEDPPRQRFPTSALLTFRARQSDNSLCYPMLHRMLSSISGLSLVNTIAPVPPPPVVTTQNVPRHSQMSPGAGGGWAESVPIENCSGQGRSVLGQPVLGPG